MLPVCTNRSHPLLTGLNHCLLKTTTSSSVSATSLWLQRKEGGDAVFSPTAKFLKTETSQNPNRLENHAAVHLVHVRHRAPFNQSTYSGRLHWIIIIIATIPLTGGNKTSGNIYTLQVVCCTSSSRVLLQTSLKRKIRLDTLLSWYKNIQENVWCTYRMWTQINNRHS